MSDDMEFTDVGEDAYVEYVPGCFSCRKISQCKDCGSSIKVCERDTIKSFRVTLSDKAEHREGNKWINRPPTKEIEWPEMKKLGFVYYPAPSQPTRDHIYYRFLQNDPYELLGKCAVGGMSVKDSNRLMFQYYLTKQAHDILSLIISLLSDPKFANIDDNKHDDGSMLDIVEFLRDALSVWIDGDDTYQINELERLKLVNSLLSDRYKAIQKITGGVE